MNLGLAIRELRKERGLTQITLASKAELSQTALSQIEKGKRPGKNTLKKISTALSIPESLIYVMGLEKKIFLRKSSHSMIHFFLLLNQWSRN